MDEKVSPGCKNCFVYKMDKRYGRDTTMIVKGKTAYEPKDKDVPPHSFKNQEMADICLKHFWEAPLKHREVFCSPLTGSIF